MPARTASRNVAARRKKPTRPPLHDRLLDVNLPAPTANPCALPTRFHALSYHRPLLLHGSHAASAQAALLSWFDAASTSRGMPWRKAWIDPRSLDGSAEDLREALSRRAYEVWISEIMLQQTRVATVVDYWLRWTARWPTIRDLAAADPDDVLAQWRGLGYYSRATRIHEAARLVVADEDMGGLLPADVETLEARVPGVGRYTAGAISAIVFGRAAALVDGNVLRVLSRQLGIYADVKSKAVTDVLWAVAEALVKDVAADGGVNGQDEKRDARGAADKDEGEGAEPEPSDRPGRWGQALMELGSTVCMPKPDCAKCPITVTCRVYNEGRVHSLGEKDVKPTLADMEDACTICEPLEEENDAAAKPEPKKAAAKTKAQATLAAFAFTTTRSATAGTKRKREPELDMDVVTSHARLFPLRVAKKAVRQATTLVCAIRREADGQYLIRRRPEKGLLAGLWEFPSRDLETSEEEEVKTLKQRKQLAGEYAEQMVGDVAGGQGVLRHVSETGCVPWVFSHLKLEMHVHVFVLEENGAKKATGKKGGKKGGKMEAGGTSRWSDDVEGESMGTGMRKCWEMVQGAEGR